MLTSPNMRISKLVSAGECFLQPVHVLAVVDELIEVLLHLSIKLSILVLNLLAAQLFVLLLFCLVREVHNTSHDADLVCFSLINELTEAFPGYALPLTFLSCNRSRVFFESYFQIIYIFIVLLLATIGGFPSLAVHLPERRFFDAFLTLHKSNSFLPLSY